MYIENMVKAFRLIFIGCVKVQVVIALSLGIYYGIKRIFKNLFRRK